MLELSIWARRGEAWEGKEETGKRDEFLPSCYRMLFGFVGLVLFFGG